MRLILLTALLLPATAQAHPSHGHHGTPKAAHPDRTVIPATYAGVVGALQNNAAEAQTALDGFKIADLQKLCRALGDLADAVPERAADLPPGPKAKAEAAAGRIATAATAVNASAKDGDLETARAQLITLNADVATLRELVL